MANPPSEDPRTPNSEEPDGQKNKASNQTDAKNPAKEVVQNIYLIARSVQRDTIAYAVLVIGLLLTPWIPLWGGALVGIVFGIYFCDEMLSRVKGFRKYLEEEGTAKSIVFAGAIVAILIWLPTLVLGAIAAVGIMALVRRSSGA